MQSPRPRTMVLMAILSLLIPVKMEQINPNCDYYQEVQAGVTYYIYNEEYPGPYPAGAACRWLAIAPQNTQIKLDCTVEIPQSPSCQSDRLAVSRTGNPDFLDAQNYCGEGTLNLTSDNNQLTVGLFSQRNGGRFQCSLFSVNKSPPEPPECPCGWKQMKRIVNGNETGVNEFPLMAALVHPDSPKESFCGGTIISKRHILTAGHCVFQFKPEDVLVVVGDHNLKVDYETPYATTYYITRITTHPSFNYDTLLNDIAVLTTQYFIAFSMPIGPACLPFNYESATFLGETTTALGWGNLQVTENKPDDLQKVKLQVTNCVQLDRPISQQQICTWTRGKDACLGDSGGPLLWQNPYNARLYLVGVISYGSGCATRVPSLYTRVTSYLGWIQAVTSETNYCKV